MISKGNLVGQRKLSENFRQKHPVLSLISFGTENEIKSPSKCPRNVLKLFRLETLNRKP